MRRMGFAPAAELAQLDAIRRISPGRVCLIIAPLAVFASQRHRDADISASHRSLDYLRAVTRENPGPKREAVARIEPRERQRSAPSTRPVEMPGWHLPGTVCARRES